MAVFTRNFKTYIESNSNFETSLNKGCFQGDDKRVKDKHLKYMLECFAGKHSDLITSTDALNIFLGKHLEYQHDFRRNVK